jgi:hypothetical protein
VVLSSVRREAVGGFVLIMGEVLDAAGNVAAK